MKLLSKMQIKAWDAYTIKEKDMPSHELMENASKVFTNWFQSIYFDKSQEVHIFCGSGNNGGDGLCVARMLSSLGYQVLAHLYVFSDKQSIDNKRNEKRVANICRYDQAEVSIIEPNAIVIDALLGNGISGELRGPYLELINTLNSLNNIIVSIDIPSGLDPDNVTTGTYIHADHVLSFETPKVSFFLAEHYPYLTRWDYRPIGLSKSFIDSAKTPFYYIEYSDVKTILKPRTPFQSKFDFGFGQLCGGSEGMFGAIILASRAAMKCGIGRLAANLPHIYVANFIAAVPEAMTTPCCDQNEKTLNQFVLLSSWISAVAVGPGLGKSKGAFQYIDDLLDQHIESLILDADALNIISAQAWQSRIPKNSIITPHEKEFEGLFGKSKNHYERIELQRQKAQELDIYIVLKGAYTTISSPDGNCYFNSTGNVGMATAGSGDVLTGMMLAFRSQGYSALETCLLSVYIHGAAGDLAASKYGQISLSASNIIEYIPETLKNLNGE